MKELELKKKLGDGFEPFLCGRGLLPVPLEVANEGPLFSLYIG